MPTNLGNKYAPSWGGYPPHMSQEDHPLWIRFKNQIIPRATAIYYDVGLGGQTQIPEGVSPEMALMWTRNTQKRADVVVETADEWIIVELRSQATGAALGRILMYRDLWLKDPPDSRRVSLMLVTDRLDQDITDTAEALGVKYIIV